MRSETKNQFVREMETELEELRERSQLRSFVQLDGVNFCSNDYLGLAEDPRLKRAVLESIECAGKIGGTGSRLLSGHDPVWNELEEEFAEFAGTEAALYFANGYAANLGLLKSEPLAVVEIVIGLVAVKALVLFAVGKIFGLPTDSSRALAAV